MADVSASLKDWSTTVSSNSPADATTVGAGLADNFQQIQSTVRYALATKGADIASATTTDIGAVEGLYHDITGTTTITGLGTVSAGIWKILQFDGALTFTHNGTSLILPGGENITTAAGDHCMAFSLGSGNWVVPWYIKAAAGAAPPFSDAVGLVRGSADATKIVRLEVDGLTTATTRVLTVQDEDGTVALTSEFAYSNVAGSSGRQALPRMWISGLTYSRDTDTAHDTAIAAGEARDDSNTDNMILSAVLTKQIDASWAVGDDAGGMDTGSVTTDTWYFLWLIKRTDTGLVDALYSTSSSSPTMPSNYDKKRLIGAVKTDGSSNILAYSVEESSGGGISSLWADPPLDVDVTEDATANTRTLGGVPTGVKVWALLNGFLTRAGGTAYGAVYISSPDANDEAASDTASPLATIGAVGSSEASVTAAASFRVRTNASAQIRTVANTTSTTLRISTLGWEWSRR